MLSDGRVHGGQRGGGRCKTSHGSNKRKWGGWPGAEETLERGRAKCPPSGEEFDLCSVASGTELVDMDSS